MKKLRIILFMLATVAVFVWVEHPQRSHAPILTQGIARIGGDFTLIDTHKHPLKSSDFRGKPMLVYMGYTHCPDICPMTLANMSAALKALGPDADKTAIFFITLDPTRDTPEVLSTYLHAFDPHIIGLTGDETSIAQVARAYKTYYTKQAPNAAGDYPVDHSGFIYLMDRNGKYVAHFDSTTPPAELSNALRSLL